VALQDLLRGVLARRTGQVARLRIPHQQAAPLQVAGQTGGDHSKDRVEFCRRRRRHATEARLVIGERVVPVLA